MPSYPNLSRGLTVGAHTFPNRLVMPPIVCFDYCDTQGMVNDIHIEHYRQRAPGLGLVIVEATCVLAHKKLAEHQLGLWSEAHIPGMTALCRAIHDSEAKALVQLHSVGYPDADTLDQRRDELPGIVDAFIAAANRAQRAGYDGVELHGAHNYLLSQLSSPVMNRLPELDARLQPAVDIIRGIRSVCGPDFLICVRMGGNDPDLEGGIAIARAYERAGVDLLHVSSGIGPGRVEAPQGFPGSWICFMGTRIAQAVSTPVIVVNGITRPEQAEELVSGHGAAMVAVARALLADAQFGQKTFHGGQINQCLQCRRCMWFGDRQQCPAVT